MRKEFFVGLFNDDFFAVVYMTSNWRVNLNDGLRGMRMKVIVDYFKLLSNLISGRH
jgi:hypothetical protein